MYVFIKFFSFLTLILCLLSSIVNAEIVKDVILTKEGRIDKDAILLYSGITIGEDLKKEVISDAIRNLYETEYFSSIKIDFQDGILTFDLIENPIVNKVYLDGSKLFSYDQIKTELLTKERGIYSRARMKLDAQRLQSIYQTYGFTSAIVEPKIVIMSNNRLDVIFEVDEGDAATIKRIDLYGNKNIISENIYDIIPLKQKKKFNPFSKGSRYEKGAMDILQTNIVNFYREKGFIDISIDDTVVQIARDNPQVIIDLHITEGVQYIVNNILIENNVLNLNTPKIKFLQKTGNIYSQEKSLKDVNKIYNSIYKDGFGYANVRSEIRNKNGNRLDIVYVISDDDVKMIKNINIIGNKISKDYIIRRELLFQDGSVLIQKDLDRSVNRLRSLGYFKDIQIKKENTQNPKEIIINIEVIEEDRRGHLTFSAGYSNFAGKELSFGFAKYNLGGSGYDVSTDFTTSRIMKNISFGVGTARFGNSKFGGGIDFNISSFDARRYGINYLSKSFSVAPHVSYRLDDNLFHTVTYSYTNSNMSNVPNQNAKFENSLYYNQYINTKTSAISNSLIYDTRDNFVLPNMGNRFSINQTIAGLGGTQKFIKHDLELTTYQQWINKASPTMLSFHAGNVTGYGHQDVLFQNRYLVSYYNMRGFGYGGIGPRTIETTPNGQQQVGTISYRGNNYAIATFEQHFPFPFMKDSSARWYGFADFGMLYGFDGQSNIVNSIGNTERIIDSKAIRSASGFGIAFPSMFGVIRLDYAIKIDAQKYDNIQKFRISLGGMPLT